MAFKIYTKTGDAGKTALIGGTKVPKHHIRIDAYGTIDELNAFIGVVIDHLPENAKGRLTLKEIQDRLFTIGAALACDPEKDTPTKIPDLFQSDIAFLEQEIDAMQEALPPMRYFILPGGCLAASHLHVARTVCRRAERLIVGMQATEQQVPDLVLPYINRLSDYLFVLCRYTTQECGVEATPWKPRTSAPQA